MSQERLMVETWNIIEKKILVPSVVNQVSENVKLVDKLSALTPRELDKLILNIPGVTHVLIMREEDQDRLRSTERI